LNLKKAWFPQKRGETRKIGLVSWCFWPGGEAANPDALHPGKAREHPQGKVYFPLRMFPGFLGPEALKLFVIPARQAELVCFSHLRYFASCESRVLRTLAQVWGRAAPGVIFFAHYLNSFIKHIKQI